jgi:DNA-directed RNA polymerase subunit F
MNMMLKSTTAIALLGAGNIEAAATPLEVSPDGEALALSKQILELNPAFVQAEKLADDLRDLYAARRRERPAALYPTRRDGMIPGVKFERDNLWGEQDYSLTSAMSPERLNKESPERRVYNCWCDVVDVEALRAFVEAPAPIDKEFIGTSEEWEAFCTESTRQLRSVPEWPESFEYDPRLWADVPDTEIHQRASEILRAWQTYIEGFDQYGTGLRAANDRVDLLCEEIENLRDQLYKTKTSSLEGLRAKTAVFLQTRYCATFDPDSTDELFLQSIVSDLTEVPDDRPFEPASNMIVASSVPAEVEAAANDPILAAIDAHRRAWAELCANCSALDAARTAESTHELEQLHSAVDAAADKLVDIVPTTMAGVTALLTYAAERAQGGNMWPVGYEDEHPTNGWDREHGVSWEVLLHRNLAKALPSIAA